MKNTHTNELENSALRIELLANEYFSKLLTKISADTDLNDQCYAVKSRIKKHKSIANKVQLKLNIKKYSACDISDIIGIRLVALLEENILSIFEALNTFFKKNSSELDINEVIYYIGDKRSTRILAPIKSMCDSESHLPSAIIVDSDRGYSSLHIVCYNTTEHSGISCNETYRIPIEFQIRSVFEDAWGEVDHKFVYSRDKNRESNSTYVKILQSHSKILKELCDTCSSHASLISQSYESKPDDKNLPTEPLGRVQEIKPEKNKISDLLIDSGVPDELVSKYKKGTELKNSGLNLEAQETFYEIYNITLLTKKTKESNLKFMKLYAGLNVAFISLKMNAFNDAISLYLSLHQEFPNIPIVSYRLGQSYGRKGMFDDAIDYLEKAKLLIKDTSNILNTLALPQEDYEHIKSKLPYLLGFYFWRKSTLTDDKNIKLKLLHQAYSETEKSLENLKEHDNPYDVYNNLLYFIIDIFKIIEHSEDNSHQKWAYEIVHSVIPVYLEKMEVEYGQNNFNALFEVKEYSKIHTIIEALATVSKITSAQSLANKLEIAIIEDPDALKKESNKEIYNYVKTFQETNLEKSMKLPTENA